MQMADLSWSNCCPLLFAFHKTSHEFDYSSTEVEGSYNVAIL